MVEQPAARSVAMRAGGEAAQNRSDLRGAPLRRLRVPRPRRGGAAPCGGDPLLGQADESDHALVGFLGAVAEREEPVLEQDQPLGVGMGGMGRHRRFGERKARHDIGHDGGAAAIDLGGARGAVGLVGQRQDRPGVGVVDEFVRQERMKQRLDRRVGRRAVEQAPALGVDHILVGQRLERGEGAHGVEPHRREALGFDGGHIVARSLDAHRRNGVAGEVGQGCLDRTVAAAVLDEARVAAEQAGGIDAQRQIGADPAGAVARHGRRGVAARPEAIHETDPGGRRRPPAAPEGKAARGGNGAAGGRGRRGRGQTE